MKASRLIIIYPGVIDPHLSWAERDGGVGWEQSVRKQREGTSHSREGAAFLTLGLERTLEAAGGVPRPSSQRPHSRVPVFRYPEKGVAGLVQAPGGLGHGQRPPLPPPLFSFQF